MSYEEDQATLAKHKIDLECYSPFEIRDKDGESFASGWMADIILRWCQENEPDEDEVMTGGPISPDEVGAKKTAIIPPQVFEAFNELIAKNWDGRQAKVYQKDAVDLIASKLGVPTNNVYDEKYLDIEICYRRIGWKVEYDKPGYNESYKAFFIFKK